MQALFATLHRVACLLVLLPGLAAASLLDSAAPELRSMSFESRAVARTMRYDVLLPAGYGDSAERYPVLYLLHGVNTDHRSWRAETGVVEQAARFGPWIVVMPDAGNSWYVNWAAAEETGSNRWEDYVVEDLVAHVDRTFRTFARREGRAIAGFSMGGYGALVLGLRNPELFASIGSSSGYLDYARGLARSLEHGTVRRPRRRSRAAASETPEAPAAWAEDLRAASERTPRGRAFADAAGAAAHDPYRLVLSVPHENLPHITLDCGMDDVLMPFTRELAEILLAERIPFDYLQLPGQHDGTYQERALGHTLPVHYEVMRRALERPAAASHQGETR